MSVSFDGKATKVAIAQDSQSLVGVKIDGYQLYFN